MYYVNCFFVYSFLGFIFENIVCKIMGNNFESGILFGPFTPIYGLGVVLILVLSKFLFKNLHMPRWKETIIVFFGLVITLTLMEWVGGVLIEKLFNITFWNYENLRFHIGKYVALEVSLVWGFLSIILIYVIHPLLEPFIRKIPVIVTYLLIIGIFIDFICTFMKYKFHENFFLIINLFSI